MSNAETDPETIERAVREFVTSNFLFGREGDALARDESFIALGVLDSTGVLELVAFVEDGWSIEVTDEEMLPENLDSIDNVIAFVQRKQTGGRDGV